MAQNWNAHSEMTGKEKIVFYLIWSIMWTISLLPFWALYLISDFLYVVAYKVIGYRKKVVENNLDTCFPDITNNERKEIEKKFYHHFCDTIVETIKLASANKETISKRVEYKNLELIEQAIEREQGVTLYLAHYCNWEWITTIGLHVSEKCYGGQVYHVLESKVMDKLMLKLRGRIGPVSIPMAEIMRRMIKVKQEGKYPVIGFISDQSPIIYNTPCWVDFLHHNTPFISGTEKLARKLHQACVYLDISKVKRGHYQIELKLLCEDAASLEEDKLTRLYAKALEETIRRKPEYWLWSHNRWKRKPEEYRRGKEE